MVKTLLNYLIYDVCIDIVFNKIRHNFAKNKLDRLPREGEYFSRISHKVDNEHYYSCSVKAIDKRVNVNNQPDCFVLLTFRRCSGDLFGTDDWIEQNKLEDWDLLTGEFERDVGELEVDFYFDLDDSYVEEAEYYDDGSIMLKCSSYDFYT